VAEPRSIDQSAAPSRQSLLALGWLNFFLSGMQSAFGPVAAAYLATQQWSARDIGFVLSIGSAATLVSQIPGGELLDIVRSKRLLVAISAVTVASSILILRLWPSFPLAIIAITLGLVGHANLAERLGRNQRFAAIGGIAATLVMAVIAYSGSRWTMFVPIAFALPLLAALSRIRADEIDFARASGAEPAPRGLPQTRGRHLDLLRNRRLLIFAACAVLFQIANASMLPLVGGMLAAEGKRHAAPLLAALIIVPQLVVALLAPWVGQRAEQRGRKPLLLIGFAALPIRALLFALVSDPLALTVTQILDGIAGAVLGVMTALVIADVVEGTGRFNLAQGLFGTMMGLGTALSTTLSGLIVHHFGHAAGFASLAGEGLVALLVLAVFLPETKDARLT
jgi:MFS family permease